MAVSLIVMNSPLFKPALPPLISCRKAFSLVEMLAVLAVISLLATMVTPALTSIFGGKNSTRALDVVSNSAALARQTAMTTGRPIALVVNRSERAAVTDTQAVLVLSAPESTVPAVDEATGQTTWVPKGTWTKMPTSVQVNVRERAEEGKPSFYRATSAGPLTGTLPIKLDGKEVTDYDYIVFYPDGSVDAPTVGPALEFKRYQGGQDMTTVAADYTLVVQSNSGRAKIIQ